MDKYKSKKQDRDLRETDGANKLCEVVKYYGGYLWYKENINEGAYDAFYWHNSDAMKYIFINKANAEAKLFFNNRQISGSKMRKMLITSKGKIVKSYEWIYDYVEYMLNKCFMDQIIRNKVNNLILENCDYCENQGSIDAWKILCARNLLGFQYDLLKEISERGVKVSKSASKNLSRLHNSRLINAVIESCPYTNK